MVFTQKHWNCNRTKKQSAGDGRRDAANEKSASTKINRLFPVQLFILKTNFILSVKNETMQKMQRTSILQVFIQNQIIKGTCAFSFHIFTFDFSKCFWDVVRFAIFCSISEMMDFWRERVCLGFVVCLNRYTIIYCPLAKEQYSMPILNCFFMSMP